MGGYHANFTKGSLLVPESRVIARLLLNKPTNEEWNDAVVMRNVLQKRTVNTAVSLANLIRSRLQKVHQDLWVLVVSGSQETTRQALLAATVKQSPLLGDFMLLVLKDLFRNFEERLNPLLWEKYLEQVWTQNPSTPRWSDSTVVNLRRTGFRILVESGFLADTKSLQLKRVDVHPEVRSCLMDHQEKYALACLGVSIT